MLLSEFTVPLSQPKFDPTTLAAELGELLQKEPLVPTEFRAPLTLARCPEAGDYCESKRESAAV